MSLNPARRLLNSLAGRSRTTAPAPSGPVAQRTPGRTPGRATASTGTPEGDAHPAAGPTSDEPTGDAPAAEQPVGAPTGRAHVDGDEPTSGQTVDGGEAAVRRITLIGKPGCHLCDDARVVIERVAADVGAQVEEINMLDHPELVAKYAEQIPVTLVDGRQHDYWRVDETRLRRALAKPAPRT